MTKILIDPSYDFLRIYNLIVSNPDKDLQLIFAEDSPFYLNSSNLVVLKKTAKQAGKNITLDTQNAMHADYMNSVNTDSLEVASDEVELDGKFESGYVSDAKGFVSKFLNFVGVGGFFSAEKLKRTFKFSRKKSAKIDNLLSQSANHNMKSKKIKIGLGVVGFFVFVAFLLYVFVVYFPKAKVNLKINSNVFVKIIDAKADLSNKSVDSDKFRVPAVSLTSTQQIDVEADATGSKEIGEKAKGTINFVNKKSDSVKVRKNTIIKYESSKNGKINFLLDDDVEVPGAVEDAVTHTVTYGQKEGKVTAENFGPEYNAGSNEKFEINKFDKDDLYAENKDKFTGGSKSTVKIITQSDIDNIRKAAETQAKDKVKSDLVAKSGYTQTIVESSIKVNQKSETLDSKVDDQKDKLKITAEYEGTALGFKQSDIDELVNKSIQTVVPESFALSDTKPEFETVATKSKDVEGQLDIQIKLRSFILPKIDTDNVKKELAGVKIDEAQAYLKKIPNVKEIGIEVTPNLPSFIMAMPRVPSNIDIVVEKID